MAEIAEKTARRIADALERIADQMRPMPPVPVAPTPQPYTWGPYWRVPTTDIWPPYPYHRPHHLPPDQWLTDNVRCDDKEDTND